MGVHLGYNYAGFGSAPYGKYWTKIRKLIMLELLSSRRLESLKHVYESEVDTFIKDLASYLSGNKNNSTKVVVVTSEWLERLSFNIITKMIAGKMWKMWMM